MQKWFKKHSYIVLMAPYVLMFSIFILIPVVVSVGLSFTYFNSVEMPKFTGLSNYIQLITNDDIFMQKVLPNTLIYGLFVGVGGYVLSFIMAWSLAQITRVPRTILAVILYSPSLTGGVLLSIVWGVIFSGDANGYLNALLLKWNWIETPILWLQSEKYLLPIMIIVSLWSSLGVGFLSMLAGILNADEEVYEAGRIDGIKNRFQEVIYITIPQVMPQMLFGAIMAITGTFTSSGVGTVLSGSNPTPGYAGQLIVNHMEDYAFIRMEMGYASAIAVALLIAIRLCSNVVNRLFGERGD
ncbi:MAG: sugar ABC transporter permease [Lachnospiraceae bacterium]|nr:sugar ABC transporter permease [Lachnospiraceae bacterium]